MPCLAAIQAGHESILTACGTALVTVQLQNHHTGGGWSQPARYSRWAVYDYTRAQRDINVNPEFGAKLPRKTVGRRQGLLRRAQNDRRVLNAWPAQLAGYATLDYLFLLTIENLTCQETGGLVRGRREACVPSDI
jgi:hypothetical protein